MVSKHLLKKFIFPLVGLFVLAAVIAGCQSNNGPVVLEEPPPPGDGAGGDPSNQVVGCQIQFRTLIQLKVSANPPGGSGTLEILDGAPFSVEAPIPIEVNGNQLILNGDDFPVIYFRPPETAADLKISAASGKRAVGTYDPETGEMNILNFLFNLEIVKKGEEELFLEGEKVLPPVALTTGEVTAEGNLNPITVHGQPLNHEDGTLALVAAMTLPTEFAPLTPLNTIIGGGALTARLEGIINQAPENCGTSEGMFPDFDAEGTVKVVVENQTVNSKIDFGSSTVVSKLFGDRTFLDCTEVGFRRLLSKKITLKNGSSEDRNIRIGQPKDIDKDIPSPLCGGSSEFIRGSIQTSGGAVCQKVTVGGKTFDSGECLLPADSSSSISFPLMYLPFNFIPAGPGEEPVIDKGKFTIQLGNNETFTIDLLGRAVPDIRDVFSLSKLIDGRVSKREIKSGGLLKIALQQDAPIPFTRKLLLQNQGADQWEQIEAELESGESFSVKSLEGQTLLAAEGDEPGALEIDLVFNPGTSALVEDHMTLRMVKSGSVTSENPEGIVAELEFNLLGTKGIPPIKGRWEMHFDYFTAMIDHVALSEPIESTDYRQRPELAPAPLTMVFEETEIEGFQNVSLEPVDVDLLDPTLGKVGRRQIMRIYSSRSTAGLGPNGFEPNLSQDFCDEPDSISGPYEKGKCSYFYFKIVDSQMGSYDDDTGQMTLPEITLRMQNPFHNDIFGIWPASNPNLQPTNFLDTTMQLSFTTQLIDRLEVTEVDGRESRLVPDPRISVSDLNIAEKRLGADCPEGFLEGGEFPRLKCYLDTDKKFLQGRVLTLRPEQALQYNIILVGVGRLPPGTTDPNLPWFLGDNGGSRMYIAIQGRLCPEGSDCEF